MAFIAIPTVWTFRRYQDGVMCMVTNRKYWKEMKEKWPHLKNEPRNARISLAMDDISPFGELRTTYYFWILLIIKTISSLGWQ